MEVTKQHRLIFFLSHVFGQLPYSLRVENGMYVLFDSRIRLAQTTLFAAIIPSLQVYGLWCVLVSSFVYIPHLSSRTIMVFTYFLLIVCVFFTLWKTITNRNVFRFWFNNINRFRFDDSQQTSRKDSVDADLIIVVVDLLWLVLMSVYDIFIFRSSERAQETHPSCNVINFLDLTSVIHFASLWEIKICCRFFMLFLNVLHKFYKDANGILRGGRKRSSKRFWLNQLKVLREKDFLAKDLVDFLHSFYMPVVLSEIIWGFTSALVTLSARVGIDTLVQVVWGIYVFWNITLVLSCCHSLEKEAEKTAQSLHELFVNCDDVQIKEEVELFSLQVLHRKIEFNALGFFKLDFTLLYSIIGSLTSYVVILSQFQDESRNPEVSCKSVD